MSEAAGRHELDERDLHALVDGEIAGPRAWAVLARLAANPEAAERAAAYARQRVALALLREGLPEPGMPPRLRALTHELCQAAERRPPDAPPVVPAGAVTGRSRPRHTPG